MTALNSLRYAYLCIRRVTALRNGAFLASILGLTYFLSGLASTPPAHGQTTNSPSTSAPSTSSATGSSTGSQAGVQTGKFAPASQVGPIEQHVRSLQARFDELESTHRAWISSDWTAARTSAQQKDLEVRRLLLERSSAVNVAEPTTSSLLAPTTADPLYGLVLAVKDNIDVAGFATTAGSRSLVANRPQIDATVVSRLRKRGVVIAGKTNLDTFARGVRSTSQLRGTTANAWDATRAAGGSSGGSAVAIATGMADAALGTDTCGSLRYPATYNAVYSLRPSAGMLSRHGVVPLSPTQDAVGPMASSLKTLRELFLAMLGPDPGDPATIDAKLAVAIDPEPVKKSVRIGVLHGFGTYALDARGRSPLDALRESGMDLLPVTLPNSVANASLIELEANAAIASFRAWIKRDPNPSNVAPWLDKRWTPTLRARWNALRAQQRRNATGITDLLDRERLDALVYPTTRFAASTLGSVQPSQNCWLSATSGLPALALPGGFDARKFPTVGIDLLGRQGSELSLLDLAERAASKS